MCLFPIYRLNPKTTETDMRVLMERETVLKPFQSIDDQVSDHRTNQTKDSRVVIIARDCLSKKSTGKR